jgi:hypothetical protein
VRPSHSSSNSNHFEYFQIHSNFERSKKDLPGLENFEIKYGFEDLEKMNNVIYRNFSNSE